MDLERIALRLAETYRYGTVERDDGTVTFSYVTHAMVDMPRKGATSLAVVALTLHPDGNLTATSATAEPGPGWDDADAQPLPLRLALPLIVEDAFMVRQPEATRVVRDGAEMVMRWLGGRERARNDLRLHADRATLVRQAVMDGLLSHARGFLGRVDPVALRLLRRHPHHGFNLADAWGEVARVGGRPAPLAKALLMRPGFPNAVMRLRGGMDAVAFADMVADPRALDAAVVDDLRRQGERLRHGSGVDMIPRMVGTLIPLSDPTPLHVARDLVPLAAKVEAGMATHMDEAVLGHGGEVNRGTSLAALGVPQDFNEDWAVGIARTLRRFPPEWVPEGPEQWAAFKDLVVFVNDLAARVGRYDDLARVLPSGGDWVAMRDRLVAAADVPVERLHSAMGDVEHMVGAYAAQVLVPLDPGGYEHPSEDDHASAEGFHDMARVVLLGGRTAARVLELSADWHRRQARMRADLAAMPGAYRDDEGWKAGLPDAVRGDVEVKVLTTDRALAHEGSENRDDDGAFGLANCLGGHGERCRSGLSRIVSLRRRLPDGGLERQSVAEVFVEGDALRLGQHVGWDNGPPPGKMRSVLAEYLADCRDGKLAVDRAGLAPVPSRRGEFVVRTCGFDPAVESTRLAVRSMWDRFVPRPMRAMDRALSRSLPHADPLRPWPAESPAPRPEPVVTERGRPEPDEVEDEAEEDEVDHPVFRHVPYR